MSFRKSLPRLTAPAVGALLFLVACRPTAVSEPAIIALEAVVVLPIESEFPVEPSGLCLRDGVLYSVCDDTDDTIFEVRLGDDHARFVPAIRFTPPRDPRGPDILDLEGIMAGPEGSFFLVSEAHGRILQVHRDGAANWVTPSLIEAGRGWGLFQLTNAGLEGALRFPDGSFLALAERQPRGWIHADANGAINGGQLNTTRFGEDLPLLRLPDFTGADRFDGENFVLFRNGELITTLEEDFEGGYREGSRAWSFRSIVQSPEWAFDAPEFGKAEGLAVDAEHFYVVLDTNQTEARVADPSDRRPLILILRRP